MEENNPPSTEGVLPPQEAQTSTFRSRASPRRPRILDIRQLDIRVGKVEDVEAVEGYEGIYTLTIDIDRPLHKTASSTILGSTGFDVYSLVDTKVVTVLNGPVTFVDEEIECDIRVLAAVKLGGEEGTEVEAMEVLRPPKSSKRGKRILAEGYVQEGYWAIKQKNYNAIFRDLKVDDKKRAVYRGTPLKVKGQKGYITSDTLADCPITQI